MTGSLNKVSIIGNVGKDPEIRTTNDGKEIANLTIATSESWTDKATGERKDKTEWHRVVCFNQGLTNVIKSYIKKGSKVYIEGQLATRKWQDSNGQDKYTTEIVLQGYNCNLQMLDSKGDDIKQVDSHNEAKGNGYQSQGDDDIETECPF